MQREAIDHRPKAGPSGDHRAPGAIAATGAFQFGPIGPRRVLIAGNAGGAPGARIDARN